ncbi:hypothetical protein ACFX2I_027239 [Malus domestica]
MKSGIRRFHLCRGFNACAHHTAENLGKQVHGNKGKKDDGERGFIRKPCLSWIDIKKEVHVFLVGDMSHPRYDEIHHYLHELLRRMKEQGYVSDTNFVLHDELLRSSFINCSLSHDSSSASFTLGYVLVGYGVSKVMESTHPRFKEGDFVWGMIGWEEYSLISSPDRLNNISFTDVPLSYYASIFGNAGNCSLLENIII